jgi:SAM-dependent methyltransferase
MPDQSSTATSRTHDYAKYAADYAKLGFEGTYYLAFRDIPALLEKHARGPRALDYGCGSGRSTRFLKGLGYDTAGIDISKDMLRQARAEDDTGEYRHIQSAEIPYDDALFDVVFSSFVFIEVSNLAEVLKPDGVVAVVTSPVKGINGNWLSFSYDFPENRRPIKSGDTIKLQIRGTDVVLYDYHWTDRDYRNAFARAGLAVRTVHTPLGRDDEGIEWKDEKTTPFIFVYLLEHSGRTADA